MLISSIHGGLNNTNFLVFEILGRLVGLLVHLRNNSSLRYPIRRQEINEYLSFKIVAALPCKEKGNMNVARVSAGS